MSDTQHIPLNKLTESDDNVRRTERKRDIDVLAASIAAHGLLQNLAVTARDDAKYEVVAGGRRFNALKLLVKQGALAKDWPVPCQIIESGSAREASLAENVQRVDMNVMDEVEAFAALVDAGATPDDVARRFGASVRHVEQRLALARLSRRIRTAYRKGDVTLDVARAFCLSGDHQAQERVFKGLPKPITSAHAVRNALSQGRTPLNDRIARFVGADTYEAAGGRIVKDLFDDDLAFLEDGDILQALALVKAEGLRDQVLSEGWSWAEIQLGHGGVEGCAAERLRPNQRKLKASEKRKLAALEAEIDALDAELETAEGESDAAEAAWRRRDEADGERDAILEAARVYETALMAHAGALVGVDRDGRAQITRGLIRRADLKTIEKLRKQATPAPEENGEDDDNETSGAPAGQRLSKALTMDLTLARTRMLRQGLARAPHEALAFAVIMLRQQSAGAGELCGVGVSSTPRDFDDAALFAAQSDSIPSAGDVRAFLDASDEELQAWLAILVAETIDLTHEGISARDRERQHASDVIAAALDLDMAAHWQADAGFWARAPRALALGAIAEAPSFLARSETERASLMKSINKMKKNELSTAAAEALNGAGWLPDCLVTPHASGAFAMTPAGADAIAAAPGA